MQIWDWDKYKYDDYIGEALIPTGPLVQVHNVSTMFPQCFHNVFGPQCFLVRFCFVRFLGPKTKDLNDGSTWKKSGVDKLGCINASCLSKALSLSLSLSLYVAVSAPSQILPKSLSLSLSPCVSVSVAVSFHSHSHSHSLSLSLLLSSALSRLPTIISMSRSLHSPCVSPSPPPRS